MSSATVTTTNMELTPVRVMYGTAGSEIDLGGTLGNVSIMMKYDKAGLIKADQYGSTILDKRVTGFECHVSLELTEIKNKDLVATLFPSATKIIDHIDPTNKAIDFITNLGDSDIAHAKSLILHPLSMADSDKTQDYNFALATASAESTLVYGPHEQVKMKMVFMVYPDLTTGKFFRYGDPAASLT